MNDNECVRFLQWSLPKLRMQWQGFRKVRGQVCKRINARLRELALADVVAYQSYLNDHAGEWPALESLCRITISRFCRDRGLFQFLERDVLPSLAETAIARGENEFRCWSIGCASGEEPYTLALIWTFGTGRRFPSINIKVLATDADENMIERAEAGCYGAGSLRELSEGRRTQAFARKENRFCIRAGVREKVAFFLQDIRAQLPRGRFHLILCRNLVFTYFDEALQRETLARLRGRLHAGGALIIGIHETLPPGAAGFAPWPGSPAVYRKV